MVARERRRGLALGMTLALFLLGCELLLGLDDLDIELSRSRETTCEAGTTRSCYSGAAGTQGVGMCVGGTQQCLPHGRGYGSCEDEVIPTAEDCSNDLDDNCDGFVACGKVAWSASWGVDSDEIGRRLVADNDGNIIATGFYRDELDLGLGSLPDDSKRNVWLAKFAPDGVVLWDVAMHGDGNLVARDVAVGADGSIVTVARLAGEATGYGWTVASAGGNDVWVVKLGVDGNHLWTRTFGDDANQEARAVAIDHAGNIVIAGFYSGFIAFADVEYGEAQENDAFVAKLDPDGNVLWAHSMPGPSEQYGLALDVGPAGEVVVAGHFFSEIDTGVTTHESAGGYDVFLTALSADGVPLWSERFGEDGDQRCYDLAIDVDGNIVLLSYGVGTFSFGGPTLSALGGNDVFVVKLTASGKHIFSKRFGDHATQQASNIDVDPWGNILIAGMYEGTIDFGGGPVLHAGVRQNNIFVAKLDADGEHAFSRGLRVWENQDTGAVARGWRGVASDPLGNVLLTGYFERGPIDFGDGPLVPAGGTDIFIAKIIP